MECKQPEPCFSLNFVKKRGHNHFLYIAKILYSSKNNYNCTHMQKLIGPSYLKVFLKKASIIILKQLKWVYEWRRPAKHFCTFAKNSQLVATPKFQLLKVQQVVGSYKAFQGWFRLQGPKLQLESYIIKQTKRLKKRKNFGQL